MEERREDLQHAPVERLEALPGLLGHRQYVDSLATVTDCMSRLAEHEGALTGVSPRRMKNMLAALAVHMRSFRDCGDCTAADPSQTRKIEGVFMNTCLKYLDSIHAQGGSSLADLAVNVPAPGGIGSDEKVILLPECIRLLRLKFDSCVS